MSIASGRATVARLIIAAAVATPLVARAGEAELTQRLERLAAELEAVKAELAKLKQDQAAGQAAAPAATAADRTAPDNYQASATASEPQTTLFSYGEINYNRPRHAAENTQADVRRLVLGVQHRFDTRTKAVFEIEHEHAVTSATDNGEVEVEQAYVERQVTSRLAVRGGLFLIPVGLLNENHEPTAFYGVERNFVETAIIPTTWREGGAQLVGTFDNGLTLQGGVSTGFNLNKWDAASTEGQESPLRAIHQELSQAKAKDLSLFAAANWRGLPGLLLGAAVFSGGVSQGAPNVANSRLTLWDVHARWTPGPWDLAALFARGTISKTASFNTALLGNPTLVPSVFEGGYVQAAYRARLGDYGVAPFARVEYFNTAKRFADLGDGLTPAPLPTERAITTGLNFDIGRNVVVKTDLQWFREHSDRNRFNLGLGWAF